MQLGDVTPLATNVTSGNHTIPNIQTFRQIYVEGYMFENDYIKTEIFITKAIHLNKRLQVYSYASSANKNSWFYFANNTTLVIDSCSFHHLNFYGVK